MKKSSVLIFLASAAIISAILLLLYVTVQQVYRRGLDDPQIQITRDTRQQLEQGRSGDVLMHADPFDIGRSLSPFTVLYDSTGKPIRSDAVLDGKMPQIPDGLFGRAKREGECRVSWQPRKGVRMALVVVPVNTAAVRYIASGRNMVEVEQRTQDMRETVFFGWVGCMIILCITAILKNFLSARPAGKTAG